MALNIKDPDTEKLARDLAELMGSKITHAVKAALEDRLRSELRRRDQDARLARARGLLRRLDRGRGERPASDHAWLYDEEGLPR